MKRLLSEIEVSQEYGLSVCFLQRARLIGRGGPDYIKLGGKLVKYRREAIEAYLESCTRKGDSKAAA